MAKPTDAAETRLRVEPGIEASASMPSMPAATHGYEKATASATISAGTSPA